MGNQHQDKWMDVLPWTVLSRHTVYQPELDASAAEMVLGQCPIIPGDIARSTNPSFPDVKDLLQALRKNAAKQPIQTSFHGKQPVYWPSSAEKATHVWVQEPKPTPLGPVFRGPYPINQRLGKSCLQVSVGVFDNGTPRFDVVHWNNCQPAVMKPGAEIATRPKLGRPKST